MRIFNVLVHGLDRSICTSGYPMQDVVNTKYTFHKRDADVKRATILAKTPQGSGHDCFLKGIIVQCDVEAPQYVWAQIQRYHWFEIVSSQSKMHKIDVADFDEHCNEMVRDAIMDVIKELQGYYREGRISIDTLLSNMPMGYEYTAGISTNYLQLKTMYAQRKSHRLTFWNREFVNFVNNLPSCGLITGEA